MKKFFTIIALSLYFIIPLKADDIRDFQIEGISIGESLLDYLSKKKIVERKKATIREVKNFTVYLFSKFNFNKFKNI